MLALRGCSAPVLSPAMPSHSRKSNRARMQTSDELEGTHDGGVSLESYENRRYTVTEIGEARDFFSQLNPKKTPYITKSDFHRQMHKVVPNASVETRELMRHVLDKDDNNRIDEAEFMASWGFMQDTLKALDGIDDDNKYEESSANLSDEKIEVTSHLPGGWGWRRQGLLHVETNACRGDLADANIWRTAGAPACVRGDRQGRQRGAEQR